MNHDYSNIEPSFHSEKEPEKSVVQKSFDEHQPISMLNWARSRAQKVLRDTSFESDTFNIYDPCFSSDEEIKDKEIRGIRPSNIDYLEHLSDSPDQSPFEKGENSFLLLSPDDEKQLVSRIDKFVIEPIRIVKLDNFMSEEASFQNSSGYQKYQEIKMRKSREQRKKKTEIPKL